MVARGGEGRESAPGSPAPSPPWEGAPQRGEGRTGGDLSGPDQDREWVERARYGDERAFERLVAKYQERTVSIARHFVIHEESARDVAQEAFLRLYRSLHRYDPKHRFYTWFYRIVVHLAIDHLRRLRPAKMLGLWEAELVGGEEGPSCRLEQHDTRRRVWKVLQRVPLKYRILLVLRDLEGFTSKDIADVAGWNHATVRWRLHRARALFRREWEHLGYDEGDAGRV
ncbi:MAG: RNA polymerase sigma factor [Planctomycetota bacterium]